MTSPRGLVWPLLLITLGVVLLLANVGVIGPISLAALASLWPVLLILLGIEIGVGRRSPLLALAAEAVVIAVAVALVVAGQVGPGRFFIGIAEPGATVVSVPRGEDLSRVSLTDADINVGAASLRLTSPTPSGEVSISVSAGASTLVIEVPSGVEARVTTSGGLMTTRVENPRFAGTETAGYATARDRVTIRITAGASSVVIR